MLPSRLEFAFTKRFVRDCNFFTFEIKMPDFSFEQICWARHESLVAGVDEAGRGPLAGPVVAAAVILPRDFQLEGLNDSKKLSAKKRELIFAQLMDDDALIWGIGEASCQEIDRINILQATYLAMRRAIEALSCVPNHCLIDGLPIKNFAYSHTGIVKGDSRSLSIAAASILAKVTRDRIMLELDANFPQYGFAQHQGYGTVKHLNALRTYGPCLHHRQSFQPVAQLSLPLE